MLNLKIFRVGKVRNSEKLLNSFYTVLCKSNILFLLIYNKIACLIGVLTHHIIHLGHLFCSTPFKLSCQNVTGFIKTCRFAALPRNNKRSSCFINKNGIDLINDGIIQPSLYKLFFIDNHVISKIIKSKLIISCICYIAVI